MKSHEVNDRISMSLYAQEQFVTILRDDGRTIDDVAEAASTRMKIKKQTCREKLYELQRGDNDSYFPKKDNKKTRGLQNFSILLDVLKIPEEHELVQTMQRMYSNFQYPPPQLND